LAVEQEQAVRLALTQRVAVLTGGPGCGKSFTVRSVIALAAAKRAKIVLAAPTGRAAKRLTELSGHPATTVYTAADEHVRALLAEALFHAEHADRGLPEHTEHRHQAAPTEPTNTVSS
jgi:hypothetical protein